MNPEQDLLNENFVLNSVQRIKRNSLSSELLTHLEWTRVFFIPPQGTQISGGPRPKRFLSARPIFWVPCLGPLFGSPVWVHSQIHCKKIRKKFYSQIQCKKFRKKFYSQIHCKKNSKKFTLKSIVKDIVTSFTVIFIVKKFQNFVGSPR